MNWQDEPRREIDPKVGEIWCDFHPGATYPWFQIEAIDTRTGIILGHRWPSPFPEGAAAKQFIAEHPELGCADISSIAYFRSWCER